MLSDKRRNQFARSSPTQKRFEPAKYRLPDVVEGIINRTLFWLALMLVEIRLKLLFGLVRVSYKFPPCPER
jgi:hypothetical protein